LEKVRFFGSTKSRTIVPVPVPLTLTKEQSNMNVEPSGALLGKTPKLVNLPSP
jgi:hypothetical protein